MTLEWATVGKTDSQVVAQHPIVARFPKSRLGGMGLESATAGKTDTQVDTQWLVVARFRISRLGGMGIESATAGKTDTEVDTEGWHLLLVPSSENGSLVEAAESWEWVR